MGVLLRRVTGAAVIVAALAVIGQDARAVSRVMVGWSSDPTRPSAVALVRRRPSSVGEGFGDPGGGVGHNLLVNEELDGEAPADAAGRGPSDIPPGTGRRVHRPPRGAVSWSTEGFTVDTMFRLLIRAFFSQGPTAYGKVTE